jgi:aspartyl-tRNA(Asn)/glutamyl-tRNA(Gln) amidotransferase subunit A
MSDLELLSATISEVAPKIRLKTISPLDLVKAQLEHIEKLSSSVNSFITIMGEQALARAKDLENDLMSGNYRGPLHGIPFGVKDNLSTDGVTTTAGSKILANFVPDEDAIVVAKMQKAGAVLVGKENMHEFALGPTSINPHYGNVCNPWDLKRIPGGSSGGSGANVASLQTFASFGTDAGGSVRIPAALCGVVGFKATYGRISLRGCLPTGNWSSDHIGPLTRSVRDCATVFQSVVGYDELDPSSVPVSISDYVGALEHDIKGLVMGIPTNFFFDNVDSEVEEAVRRSIVLLEELGVEVREVAIDGMEHMPILRRMSMVEALVYHEHFMRIRAKDYGEDVFFRVIPSQFYRAIDYAKSMRLRRLLKVEFAKVMSTVDFLVVPTTPVVAFPIDDASVAIKGVQTPVVGPGVPSLVLTQNTGPSNVTGLPSITVPCGLTAKGLPIGVQFIGRSFEEELILRVAHNYEIASGHQRMIPPFILNEIS